MEWALLADGVTEDQVYKVLETKEGHNRAFAMLDKIKPFIVWWENANDPINLIESGEVTMSLLWSGSGGEASRKEGTNLSLVWGGQMVEMDLFGIVKGTLHKQAAIEFIQFASSSKALADQAKYISYGPTRKSSLSLIPKSIRETLPNSPKHADKRSLYSDARWWADNNDVLAEHFRTWVNQATTKGVAGTVH